jgi:hypothetical protein
MRSDELGGHRHERRNEYRGKWAPSPYPDVPTHLSSRCGAKPRYARCRGCSVPSNRAASYFPRPSARPRLSPRMSACSGSCRRPSEVRRKLALDLCRPGRPSGRGRHAQRPSEEPAVLHRQQDGMEASRASHGATVTLLRLKRLKRMLLANLTLTKHGRAVLEAKRHRAARQLVLRQAVSKPPAACLDMIASAGPDLSLDGACLPCKQDDSPPPRMTPMPPAPVILGAPRTRTILTITRWRHWLHWTRPKGRLRQLWGERSGAPSGLRPSLFVMCNTPVEVQFTSARCLNYPCRTPRDHSKRADHQNNQRCRSWRYARGRLYRISARRRIGDCVSGKCP